MTGYTAGYTGRSIFVNDIDHFSTLGPEQSFENGVQPLVNFAAGYLGKLDVRSTISRVNNYTVDSKVIYTSYDEKRFLPLQVFGKIKVFIMISIN